MKKDLQDYNNTFDISTVMAELSKSRQKIYNYNHN